VNVAEIIECVDIVEYISQFCDLELRADGEYWGLSPLQDENTPSFSVNKDKQRFYDFSSGKSGNVLDFIRFYNNCEFHKGLKILKDYAKVDDKEGVDGVKRLLSTSIAKKYVTKKKAQKESKSSILPHDYMDRYELNEEKMSVWEDEGITMDSMKKYGVRYDKFSDRIVYPIKNMNGDIINVSGRTLDKDYKAKKLRKYTYFHSLGILDTIYGLSDNMESVLKKKELILFEGAKSVMMANGWEIENTGAILTSHLNPYQMKIIIKLGVTVVFALDSDVDITKDPNIMKLLPYVNVFWVKNRDGLLDEKDSPVDKGLDVWKSLYDRRQRLK